MQLTHNTLSQKLRTHSAKLLNVYPAAAMDKQALPVRKPNRGRPHLAKNGEPRTTAEALGTAANIATWVYEGGAGGEVKR